MKTALSPKLYFSYSQFMVYDATVQLPGCSWTEKHTAQGFARRESVVNFNTLLEFGYADVTVSTGNYKSQPVYERVIAVPFLVTSGKVVVDGPDETNVERSFDLSPGNYRLVAAQYIADDEEVIDLFFEPLTKSQDSSAILVADKALNTSMPFVETANIAGEE